MKSILNSVIILLMPLTLDADLSVASIFSDHMVLQRAQQVPVWGKASPGAEVEVLYRTHSARGEADNAGDWRVTLPQLEVGEADNLVIRSGDQSIVLKDVLVGEVWICSGQSNMMWPLKTSAGAEETIAGSDLPAIRLLVIPRVQSAEPQDSVEAAWQVCSPETTPDFSAVAYHFGRKLFQELDVPIGLISSNWGGSPAEAWTPLSTLRNVPELTDLAAAYDEILEKKARDPNVEAAYQAKVDAYLKAINTLAEAPPAPESSAFDPEADFDADGMVTPGVDFLSKTDGMVSVRTVFFVSLEEAGRRGAVLKLGRIDNFDSTWINGVRVGQTTNEVRNARRVPREYPIPDGTLVAGDNVIILQIVDVNQLAHFGKNIEAPLIEWPEGKSVKLPAKWQMRMLEDLGPRPRTFTSISKNTGSFLYNGMIAPLIPFAIKGVIWYQGESNATRAEEYRTLFPAMIRSWRDKWGQGDFPFYFVQLANLERGKTWPELREAQLQTLQVPNTGMVVTIDIGDSDDIHPQNKQDVGERLALWALAKAYKGPESIVYSGPLFRDAAFIGSEVHLDFQHTDGGLRARDGGKLTGFVISDGEGPFLSARARIENQKVVVSHPEIGNPAAVRYAWSPDPAANLINGAGLPASPFRTDTPD